MTAQEAKELRIGNKLLYKATNPLTGKEVTREVYVTPFEIDAIYAKDTERHKYFPIPITEERLMKFGFEWEVSRNGKFERWGKNGVLYIDKINHVFHHEFVVVGSVHQLQNLYFALTGEELTMKEGEQ